MIESKYGIDKNLIFRDNFQSPENTFRLGWTSTSVTYNNWVATLNGTSSYIPYTVPLNWVYTIRIRFNSITNVLNQYLFDWRFDYTSAWVWYVYSGNLTQMTASTGTVYVNWLPTTTYSSSTKEITITWITMKTYLTAFWRKWAGTSNYLTAWVELFEIYKWTLTARQVASLYNNSIYKNTNPIMNLNKWIKWTWTFIEDNYCPNTQSNRTTNPSFVTNTSNWAVIWDATVTRIVWDWPNSLITTCAEVTTSIWTSGNRIQWDCTAAVVWVLYTISFWAKSISWDTTLAINNYSPNPSFTIDNTWKQYSFISDWTGVGSTIRLFTLWASVYRITWVTCVEYAEPLMSLWQKYFECTSAWYYSLPSKQAYWTWEFNWYWKWSPDIILMSDIIWDRLVCSYVFRPINSVYIYLQRKTVTRLNTAINYVALYNWYRWRVTRDKTWLFSLYIKGWVYTNWTLVSLVWGSWTNPIIDAAFTSSKFFTLDLDVWDKVSDIRFTPYIV